MENMVLEVNTLPAPLYGLFSTERVRVIESQGEVRLAPIKEADSKCPLLGMFSSDGHVVDRFMARKQAEKGLEL
jgi:hypothetical protein